MIRCHPRRRCVGGWVASLLCVWPELRPSLPRGRSSRLRGRIDGSGNNCLIRRIAQILDGPHSRQKSRTLRGRCVAVRTSLVDKYGRSPHDELDLTAWWCLIIEELGGRPQDWNVLCWAGYMYENVECFGDGARRARLRHSIGLPGRFEPLWVSIGVLPAAPLQPLNVRPGNPIDDGGVEVIPDAIVGPYGKKKDTNAPQQETGYRKKQVDTASGYPTSHAPPENSARRAGG